jgi:cyclic pyranopterin phosphate synthase
LRIAVTDRCNLRCVYCMPAADFRWRPRSEILSLEEILRVADLMVRLGIEKIRLTGGEPTLRQNVEWLIAKLARLPGLKTLGMTTNGARLREKAHALRAAGLQTLNVSLDTLRAGRFTEITKRNRLADVLAGIDTALDAGFRPLKINVVVVRGVNDDELCDFADLAREKPINVRFIEFMPFAGNAWQRERVVPWHIAKQTIEERYALVARANESGVTRDFDLPAAAGWISFISPLTAHFCDECNRLRLTADGAIKSCLLRGAEVNLRDVLRAKAREELLAERICSALAQKNFAHPPECELPQLENRCMTEIGG